MTKPEIRESKDARAASFTEFPQSDVPPDQAAEFAQWWVDDEQACLEVEALGKSLKDVEGTATVGVAGAEEKTNRRNEIQAQITAMQGGHGAEIIRRSREAQPAPATTQQVAHLPDHAPATSNRDGWSLHKPERFQGYIVPLYRLLRASHTDGKSKPSARDVLEAWRDNQPAEIAKMLSDGFDYYDRRGNTKPVSLQVLQKAIDRMTKPR